MVDFLGMYQSLHEPSWFSNSTCSDDFSQNLKPYLRHEKKKKKIQFCTDNAIKVSIILKVDCSEIALSNLITLVIYDRFIYDTG